jgi:hypothetical protein
MRPWIATVAAYALALQVLLTGVAAGHLMAAGDASASSLFVICHGNASSDDQELPGKEPLAQSPCMLCTLAKAPCAILPSDHGIAVSDAMGTSNAAPHGMMRRPRAALSRMKWSLAAETAFA